MITGRIEINVLTTPTSFRSFHLVKKYLLQLKEDLDNDYVARETCILKKYSIECTSHITFCFTFIL